MMNKAENDIRKVELYFKLFKTIIIWYSFCLSFLLVSAGDTDFFGLISR